MSFAPIQFDGRRSLGVRFGYMTKGAGKRSKARLRFSIAADYVAKMVWRDGESVRLEVDAKAGLARLVTVGGSHKAARRLSVRPTTGRGQLEYPYSGAAPEFFAAAAEMTELSIHEVKATEGLLFAAPVPATPATGGAVKS